MHTIRQWIGSQGQWTRSSFSDLPELDEDESTTLQRWRVVAGGLALILSRAGPQVTRRFPSALELYRLLRRRLRHSQSVDATPELLTDVMHEITDIADPMTKACINGCLQASLREAKRHADLARSTLPPSGPPQSQAQSSTRSCVTRSSQVDDAVTEISTEVLIERSSALRRTVASARNTDYAELR